MTEPSPFSPASSDENLPLRRRATRTRDAEIIRQEFVQSRRPRLIPEGDSSPNPATRDEP